MATPITWQNVMGPSLADASRPLESAQRTFSGIFDNLGGLLRDAETRQEAGRNILKDRNADTLRDLFANAKTPEEVAQANIQAQALKAQFGNMIRPGDVRGLDENRLTAVRTNLQNEWKFTDTERDRNEFSTINGIQAKLNSTDPVIRAQGALEARNANVRDQAALTAFARDAERSGLRWDEEQKGFVRAQEKHVWDGNMNRAQIGHMANQDEVARGQLAVSQGQLGVSQRQVTVQEANAMSALDTKLRNEKMELIKQRGMTYGDDPTSKAGQDRIEETIASIKDPDDQKQARLMIAEAQKKYPNAPVSVLQQVGRGTDAAWAIDMFVRSGGVSDVGKAVKAGVGSAEAERAAALRTDLSAMEKAIDVQRGRIPAMFGGAAPAERIEISGSGATPQITTAGGGNPVAGTPEQEAALKAMQGRPAPVAAAPAPTANVPAQREVGGVKFDPRATYERGTPEFKAQVAAQQQRWDQGQIELQARSRNIAEKQQAEARAAERRTAERNLAVLNARVESITNVTDKNPNKKRLLEKATADRDKLKAMLGN